MKPITPAEIRRILEVTDRLGIHRESVVIPLAKDGDGAVQVKPGDKLEIVAPEGRSFDDWIPSLPEVIGGLDLTGLKKIEPED